MALIARSKCESMWKYDDSGLRMIKHKQNEFTERIFVALPFLAHCFRKKVARCGAGDYHKMENW